ncbi:hypothetical protein FNO01nite_34530 [Flavobacterium noncentrifugens]|uniref:Uncharacterized protein n=1 Tax=Flavobacterium noncentrifugens TaxID=1128970 RepID=A0A1G9C3L5_9FLAO|nr:hypothetical protein [Flavobacterium noncentrifugens]GEP52781.1 hypothetical protein FNO01nite_34530 [Flavobacterium noncentrifugens]SDK45895.1 hypothetical protein SAMN04487935_3452 [Flavobacterium noncentrifugens]
MKDIIIRQYLEQLKSANSNTELSSILSEIIRSGVSIPELMMYFKTHQGDFETKSQDHQNTISNSNKAQVIMQLLMQKLNR